MVSLFLNAIIIKLIKRKSLKLYLNTFLIGYEMVILKTKRGGFAVKTTCCSPRESKFYFQQSHGSFQPSVTPVPGHRMPSSGLSGHQLHTWHTNTHVAKTLIHVFFFFLNGTSIKYEITSPDDSHSHGGRDVSVAMLSNLSL